MRQAVGAGGRVGSRRAGLGPRASGEASAWVSSRGRSEAAIPDGSACARVISSRRGRFLARRCLQAVPLLLVISGLVFLLIHSAPGGPLAIYLSNPNVRPEDIERLRRALGLDRPLWQQVLVVARRVRARRLGLQLQRRPSGRHPHRRTGAGDARARRRLDCRGARADAARRRRVALRAAAAGSIGRRRRWRSRASRCRRSGSAFCCRSSSPSASAGCLRRAGRRLAAAARSIICSTCCCR